MDLISYRDCPSFGASFQDMEESWNYSKSILEKLNQSLSSHFNENNFAIAVAGSFGRFEAGEPSDLDFFILTDKTITTDIHGNVTRLARELGLKLPNPNGVFPKVLKIQSIIDNIGNKNEIVEELAQRLLLILETQPIYNEHYYKRIIDDILNKYLYLHIESPKKEIVILLNDLIRYFRYICVNYQYNVWSNGEEKLWCLRNIKLRHSRIIMYAGLLFLILNASKYGVNKIEYIKSKISLTPLERIVSVLNDNDEDTFTLYTCYNKFLSIINDAEKRNLLINIEYSARDNNPIYLELKKNSDLLQSYLVDAILSMKKNWSKQIFEYLIF